MPPRVRVAGEGGDAAANAALMGALALVVNTDVVRQRAAECLVLRRRDGVGRRGGGWSEDGFPELLGGLGCGSLSAGGAADEHSQDQDRTEWQSLLHGVFLHDRGGRHGRPVITVPSRRLL